MTQQDPWDSFGGTVPRETSDAGTTAAAQTAEAKPEVVDKRQAWTCVTPEGPRTVRRTGPGAPAVVCPVFRSDDHLAREMVRCPTCGGTSVRHALPGEG